MHNDQGAFGWSAGVYTWQLNLALTMAAIVFMIPVTRDLARIDPSAPIRRFVQSIIEARGDFNGRILSLRHDDLKALCVLVGGDRA